MNSQTLAASAAAIALLISQAAQAAPSCWGADEYNSARLQNLNTLLMIETLKCENTLPQIRANYDAFVENNRDAIVTSEFAVQAHFVKKFGYRGGQEAFHNYETALGNDLSDYPASYDRCEDMVGLTQMAAKMHEDDLPALADLFAGSMLIERCETPGEARRMNIDVWSEKPPKGVLRAPVEEPQLAARETARQVPLVAAATPTSATEELPPTPSAVETASDTSDLVEPEQAPADAAAALAAAAAALAQAAEALRR